MHIYLLYSNTQPHFSQYFECSPDVSLAIFLFCYAFQNSCPCAALLHFCLYGLCCHSPAYPQFLFPCLAFRTPNLSFLFSLFFPSFLQLCLFSYILHTAPLSFLLFLLPPASSSMLLGRMHTTHCLLVPGKRTLVPSSHGYLHSLFLISSTLHIYCYYFFYDPSPFKQKCTFWQHTSLVTVFLYLFLCGMCWPLLLLCFLWPCHTCHLFSLLFLFVIPLWALSVFVSFLPTSVILYYLFPFLYLLPS